MDRNVEEFMGADQIAVVGVSDKKFGGAIYKTMKKRGYDVYPVNPSRELFNGDKCYADLGALPAEVKAAVIAVAPEKAEMIINDAAAAGITHLWFQQGKDFSKAAALAAEKNLNTVTGKCILMYAEPVTGVHALHRFLAKLFGKF